MKLQKTVHTTANQKTRLYIKQFRDIEAAYTFLNNQPDNRWSEYEGPLSKGIYAKAGGIWHDVKKLDSSLLAHI